MRVDWALPCRYTEVNDNLATIVGASVDTVQVLTLPATIPVTIAVRLVAALDELGEDKPHELRCVARNADLEEVGEVQGTASWPVPEAARADWLLGIHLPLVVQFEAGEEGTYTLDISVDGNGYPVPMHVVLAASG